MEVTVLLFCIVCVCGYPLASVKKYTNQKNVTKHIPSIADIRLLEREIWKASSRGDVSRAVKLESRLEGDILRAALNAVSQNRKDPGRSKRELRELGMVVRRDKRTVQMLTSIVTSGTKAGLDLLFNNQVRRSSAKESLRRIPRQDAINITALTENIPVDNNDELNNEIESMSNGDEIVNMPPTTMSPEGALVHTDTEEVTEQNTPVRQEDEENPDEEDGGGGIGGLIGSFLGSLSTPEGGVDIGAVTGLLGGLSTQNEDGSYDFTGLQDTVGSLFGGGEEEGGSNVGQFLGGLVGAAIRGSAGDAAAKGAGQITGNIFTAVLPGLSAYPTPEEGPNGEEGKPQEGLDSGGFFSGLLGTVLGSLAGGSSGGMMGGGGISKLMQFKFKIFRSVFSVITKLIGGSSG